MTIDQQSYPAEDPALILWPAGINRPWRDLIDIATRARMDGISLSPLTLRDVEKDKDGSAGFGERLAAAGLHVSHLDGVSSWAPERHPDRDDPAYGLVHPLFDFSVGELLDLAGKFNIRSVAAVGAFSKGAIGFDEICRSFADFCDQAKAQDIWVDLEFIPHWGIPDLPAAWRLLSAVDKDNCGILVDNWHLQKGSADFEADMALLDEIPGRFLRALQLCDDTVEMRETTTFGELIKHGRGFPGEGELAVDRVLTSLLKKGGLKCVGAEPFSAELADLSADEIALRTDRSVRGALATAYEGLRSTCA